MSEPIRVGIIGVSVTGGWAVGAHIPYLTSPSNKKFIITAVCNSSVESASRVIEQLHLRPSTKAYGNVEEMAKDSNVDLIVCTTRVDKHFDTISPALRAGKNVYVEWPLATSAAQARELLQLAEASSVKFTAVGLQARLSPDIKTVKRLLEEGRIGKPLSSTWIGYADNLGESTTPKWKYLGQRESGGNLVSIFLGHVADYIQCVLGYGFQGQPKCVLSNVRPHAPVYTDDGELLEEQFVKDTPDTLFLTGTLSTGIPLSITMRGGRPFKRTPGYDWRIYGEKGEIRISSSSTFLNTGAVKSIIEIHNFEDDEVDEIEMEKDIVDAMVGMSPISRYVGRVYEAIAEGRSICTFEDAVQRHDFLDSLWKEGGFDA